MALVFPNDFYLVGVTPQSGQFDLDRITRHWKTNGATEEEVLSCPTLPKKGDAHPVFPFMFVTDLQAQETGANACALDVHYMGAFRDDGEGNPIMPPSQSTASNQIGTATSQNGPIGGFTLGSPVTIEFYAPATSKSWISNAPGALPSSGDVADPSGEPQIVTMSFAASAIPPLFTGDLFQFFRTNFFSVRTTRISEETEIVAGQYWKNRASKKTVITPFDYSVTGALFLANPGSGYTSGDGISVNGVYNTAFLNVTSVDNTGRISTWSVVSSHLVRSESSMPVTGGTGSGARFGVTI